jgi:endonuclease/exonuclease/phosphatase family metal-dependent hydrolase
MKYKKSFLKVEKVFFFINIFFAALLLCSYLSAVVSPQKFWPLAFLGLTYFYLLGINLLFSIYWAVRLKKYFIISAISILAGYNVLLNSIEFNSSSKPASLQSIPPLKLMTYNVHNFRTLDEPLNLPAEKSILGLINLNQPDIIGFEEFYTQYGRFKICDSLKGTLHTDQYYFEPFLKGRVDSTGLALFSKYPIVHKGIVRLSNKQNDNQGIYIDIKYNSHFLRIYCFHLKSLELNDEDYYNLDKFSHKGVIRLHGLKKIILKLKEGFIIRGQQVDLIRQNVAKCPYPYIFLGDFNDTPSSYAFNQMAMGMKNAFREKGNGIAKTFNGGFASFQIDFILLSTQFHVLNYEIIRKRISDHYPVCSEVELN